MTPNRLSQKLITVPNASGPPGGFVSRMLLVAAICALIALSVPTGLVALMQSVGAVPLPYNLYVVDEALPGIFKLHMLASGGALALMPAVLATRHAMRRWHRPLGRLTAALVIAGALTSFPVAHESTSSLVARLGFAAQGTVWLALIVAGIIAIRRGERHAHGVLMLAMAAVASGAIWVRLTTTIATAWRLPFDPIYGCAAWLGWLVPLLLVLAFASRRGNPRPRLASALAT